MATVTTTQGEFEICLCGNPEGHIGAVWHPELSEHPSGAKLKGKQSSAAQQMLDAVKTKRKVAS